MSVELEEDKCRHESAIEAWDAGSKMPLDELTARLLVAIEECDAQEVDASTDPAVILFARMISFRTHADSMSRVDMKEVLERCYKHVDKPYLPSAPRQ